MRVEWLGQSAFRLDDGSQSVLVDPFNDMSALADERGMRFDYPPISGVSADLVLVTHEHVDHNGVDAVEGDPEVLRSTAGGLESKLGEVKAIVSEHDDEAGSARGPNTIFVFTLGGIRVCHFGDFGQAELREAQARAVGEVDLLFVPVGGGPTIGGERAARIVERIGPRWVVPMHYRTDAIDFLEPADEFLAAFPDERVVRLREPAFDTGGLSKADGPVVVVPSAPGNT